MLGEALNFPTSDDDWLKTTLIGGVLVIAGVIVPIVPGLFIQGLMVRVMRAPSTGADMPEFDDWEALFVDGIKLFAVQFLYLLVPVVLLVFALFVAVGGAVFGSQGSTIGAGVGIVGGLLVLVSILAFLVALYLLPAALAHFAHDGDVSAAFDLETVRRVAFTSDYLIAILLALVVGMTLGFIAALLSILLVGVFLGFYVQVVTFHLIGQGYARGMDLTSGDGTPTEAAL